MPFYPKLRPLLAVSIFVLVFTALFGLRPTGPETATEPKSALTRLDHFIVDLGAAYQPMVKFYAHHVIKGPRIEEI